MHLPKAFTSILAARMLQGASESPKNLTTAAVANHTESVVVRDNHVHIAERRHLPFGTQTPQEWAASHAGKEALKKQAEDAEEAKKDAKKDGDDDFNAAAQNSFEEVREVTTDPASRGIPDLAAESVFEDDGKADVDIDVDENERRGENYIHGDLPNDAEEEVAKMLEETMEKFRAAFDAAKGNGFTIENIKEDLKEDPNPWNNPAEQGVGPVIYPWPTTATVTQQVYSFSKLAPPATTSTPGAEDETWFVNLQQPGWKAAGDPSKRNDHAETPESSAPMAGDVIDGTLIRPAWYWDKHDGKDVRTHGSYEWSTFRVETRPAPGPSTGSDVEEKGFIYTHALNPTTTVDEFAPKTLNPRDEVKPPVTIGYPKMKTSSKVTTMPMATPVNAAPDEATVGGPTKTSVQAAENSLTQNPQGATDMTPVELPKTRPTTTTELTTIQIPTTPVAGSEQVSQTTTVHISSNATTSEEVSQKDPVQASANATTLPFLIPSSEKIIPAIPNEKPWMWPDYTSNKGPMPTTDKLMAFLNSTSLMTPNPDPYHLFERMEILGAFGNVTKALGKKKAITHRKTFNAWYGLHVRENLDLDDIMLVDYMKALGCLEWDVRQMETVGRKTRDHHAVKLRNLLKIAFNALEANGHVMPDVVVTRQNRLLAWLNKMMIIPFAEDVYVSKEDGTFPDLPLLD